MTTITLPRATVGQALEALTVAWQQNPRWQITESMHALRSALAQQAEPVEPITRLFGTLPVHDAQQAEPVEPVAEPVAAERERCAEYLMQQAAECRENSPTRVTLESCAAVLRLGLVEWVAQQAEPVEQMPVGWLESPHGAFRADPLYKMQFPSQLLHWQIALYTAPPKLVPLTDEEIVKIRISLPHFVSSAGGHPYEWAVRYTRAVERALEEKNCGR